MNRQELESNVKFDAGKTIAYLENNMLMGLVDKQGADIIIESAKREGYSIEESDCYFNVIINRDEKVSVNA